MATARTLENESYVAAADLSTHQYKLVEVTGTDQVNVCNNAGDRARGVLLNKPKQGEAVTVAELGVSKILCDGSGAAIAYGDPLKTNASGIAVKAVTNNDWVIGHATEAVSAANIIGGVNLNQGGYHLGV